MVAKTNMAIDPEFPSRLVDITQDGRPVGDGLGVGPGPERVAQRVHIRIRADTGVAEQVPGPSDAIAAFENGIRPARTGRLEMIAGSNPRDSRTDDQDIEMFRVHRFSIRIFMATTFRQKKLEGLARVSGATA